VKQVTELWKNYTTSLINVGDILCYIQLFEHKNVLIFERNRDYISCQVCLFKLAIDLFYFFKCTASYSSKIAKKNGSLK